MIPPLLLSYPVCWSLCADYCCRGDKSCAVMQGVLSRFGIGRFCCHRTRRTFAASLFVSIRCCPVFASIIRTRPSISTKRRPASVIGIFLLIGLEFQGLEGYYTHVVCVLPRISFAGDTGHFSFQYSRLHSLLIQAAFQRILASLIVQPTKAIRFTARQQLLEGLNFGSAHLIVVFCLGIVVSVPSHRVRFEWHG